MEAESAAGCKTFKVQQTSDRAPHIGSHMAMEVADYACGMSEKPQINYIGDNGRDEIYMMPIHYSFCGFLNRYVTTVWKAAEAVMNGYVMVFLWCFYTVLCLFL